MVITKVVEAYAQSSSTKLSLAHDEERRQATRPKMRSLQKVLSNHLECSNQIYPIIQLPIIRIRGLTYWDSS